MANFDRAFEVVLKHEGGYVNDPDDLGGETYKGISRVHHPDWSGWKRIDKVPKNGDISRLLEKDKVLQRQVGSFYKAHYWDRILGDDVPDQDVAMEVFDTGINMGLRRAVRFLQETINLLDRNAVVEELKVDGWLGKKTLGALKKNLKQDDTNEFVIQLLNILQGHRYIEIMRRNPSQERFARGWLKRARLTRETEIANQ